MSRDRRPRALATLAFLLVPRLLIAATGVYLEQEVVKTQGSAPPRVETARTWLVPGKLRKEDQGGGTVTILRDDTRALWVLNPAEKTWFEVDREAFDEMGRMGLAALMTGGDDDAASWFVKTGREKRVGSWKAYEVLAEDRPIPGTRFSIWLSPEVPIDARLRESAQMAFGAANPGARFLEALRKLDGYPVEIDLTLRAGSAILSVRQTLRKIEAMEIGDERFSVPDGYTRSESPFAGLLPGGAASPPVRSAAPSPARSPVPAPTAERPVTPRPSAAGSPSASPAAPPASIRGGGAPQ